MMITTSPPTLSARGAAMPGVSDFGSATADPMALAVTPMEEFLFDLRGYLVLKKAIASDHLREINATLDPPLRKGE